MPSARFSHTLRGSRPRARMSSENEVSFAKFFSTRLLTKVPGALLADQQAFLDQFVDGLAHGDARDGEHFREIALGRQRVVGPDDAVLDGRAQRALQLLIQRLRARFVERRQNLRQ